MGYKIRLDIFEGPLDLLLYLIQKNELDIHDIPITLITEQYLEYLTLMQSMNLEVAGEFLVMASTLMRIKSKMLLPDPVKEEMIPEEGDPREELIRQLLEYKRFKEAASQLRDREQLRAQWFTRHPGEIELEAGDSPFVEVSIFDLITAFGKVLQDMPREVFHEVVKDEFTVAEKIHDLLHFMVRESKVRFRDLFRKAKNRLEAITIFLAVLELARLREIMFCQPEPFGEIEITRNLQHQAPSSGASGGAEDGGGPKEES